MDCKIHGIINYALATQFFFLPKASLPPEPYKEMKLKGGFI